MMPPLTGLWAIKPEALSCLADRLTMHEKAVAASNEHPATAKPYVMDGNIAVVPVSGSLSKNGLRLWGIDWLTSMRAVGAALRQAEADPAVRAILLDVDSPGGTVDGVEELSGTVAAVAAAKPLFAWADGLMASAAYWLACGARAIAAPATAQVGSIGVVMLQRDISRALEDSGVKYTVFTAGHYKAAGNPVQPLTEDMRAYLQSGIDDVYELFLKAVEQGRHVSREQALTMADGKVFLAGEALKVGLIDRVCSRESFISHIKETLTMTLAELKAQYPEAVKELRAELDAESSAVLGELAETARAEGVCEGAKAEQTRLVGIAAALLGDAAAERLRVVAASGVAPDVLANLQKALGASGTASAVPDKQQEALSALKAAAAAVPLTPLAALGETEAASKQDFESLVDKHMQAHDVSRGKAISAVAAAHPEAHEVWIASQQKGRN